MPGPTLLYLPRAPVPFQSNPRLHMLIKLALPSPQLISPPHPCGNLQAASSHTCPPFTHPAQPPSHATPTPCVCAGTHEPSVFGTLHFSSSDTLPRHRFLISYTYVPTSSRLLLCTQMPITQAPHPSRASRAGGSWSQLHLLLYVTTPKPPLLQRGPSQLFAGHPRISLPPREIRPIHTDTIFSRPSSTQSSAKRNPTCSFEENAAGKLSSVSIYCLLQQPAASCPRPHSLPTLHSSLFEPKAEVVGVYRLDSSSQISLSNTSGSGEAE